MYLSSCINCKDVSEAIEKAKAMKGHIVVHEHKDGAATVNVLQEKPLEPGQPHFQMGKTAWRGINQ